MVGIRFLGAEAQAEMKDMNPKFSHKPCVYWYFSFRCNLACKHCWVNSFPTVDTSNDLTTEEALAAMKKLRELNPMSLLLSGGEVLFRPDIYILLEGLIAHKLRCDIETNGILVNTRLVQLLRRGLDEGVEIAIHISLDGGTPEAHNWLRGRQAFERTMKGIAALREADIPVEIQCIINQKDIESIPRLFEIAEQYTLRALKFGFVNPVGRGQQNYDQLGLHYDQYTKALWLIAQHLPSFKQKVLLKVPPAIIPPTLMPRITSAKNLKLITSCMFPLLGILPDGTVTICALTRGLEQVRFGNVKTDSLVEIWSRKEIALLRSQYERAVIKGICGNCIFRHHCKGSCRAYAFTEFGTFQEPHPLCTAFDRDGKFPSIYKESWRKRNANGEGNEVGRDLMTVHG
ncbi:MAG: putative mycofactocin radical SAM maturase MftC [Syntrophomonadaceae bacterium]|nr:putative mycofactocin radical SAM maturase MftC [Bacillota bacterium]